MNQQGIDISRTRDILCFLCLEFSEFNVMNCLQLLNCFFLCFRIVDTVGLELPPQNVLHCVFGFEAISGNVFLLWRTMNVMNWECKRMISLYG